MREWRTRSRPDGKCDQQTTALAETRYCLIVAGHDSASHASKSQRGIGSQFLSNVRKASETRRNVG